MRQGGPSTRPTRGREGFVLIAVLLVVSLLSLAAYQYAELMMAEARSFDRTVRMTQARALADSGVHYAAAMLADPATLANDLGGNPFDNPGKFQAIEVQLPGGRVGRFSVVAVADATDPSFSSLPTRYGVVDEAGRINLNTLMQLDRSGTVAYQMLSKLGMPDDVANAILDWIDSDEDVRVNGAESQYYASLRRPYRCKNGPLDSLEELLLVRGVSPLLLFGSDRNRNGRSDLDEGGSDELFDRGWAPYLTIYSRELNQDVDGAARTFLNDRDLTTLASTLQGLVGAEVADFIVAYRLYGAENDPPAGSPTGGADALSAAVRQATSGSGGARPRFSIASLLDLVDTQVAIPAQEEDQPPTIVPSPFNDPGKQRQYLPILYDKTTTQQSPELPGRINVNTAPRAVLLTLPGLTESEVQTILDRRPSTAAFEADPVYQTPAWLLTEAGLPVTMLKPLERYLTARTQVYRVQSIGYFDDGGIAARVEAVIDTNQGRPRIVYYRDLTELGRGFEGP
jgi:type II secretory pathway component PulK